MQVTHNVVIIGAGFGGLGMAIRLKAQGEENILMIEKGHDVGGCWRDNTYPGAACDVPSHLYSFSFERHYPWSRRFAPQQEIFAYQQYCARKYDLYRHIRFNTEVADARYRDEDGIWEVTLTNADTLTTRVLITATGQLNQPAYPPLSGIEDFDGAHFHSARWDHDVDLTGKTVAVVGTGASAIQFVPEVAKVAGKVKLFQRSAAHVIAKPDRAYSKLEHQVLSKAPITQTLDRLRIYATNESRALGFTSFQKAMKVYEWLFRRHLKQQIKDPALRAKLTPDYTLGCKRVLMSNQYYPALNQDNVDVFATGLKAVRGNTLVGQDGSECEVDTIILGTGFFVTEPPIADHIYNDAGDSLSQMWKDGMQAYRGTTIAGLPNAFMVLGPNLGIGHNSAFIVIEAQINYILSTLTTMREQQLSRVEVKADSQKTYNRKVQKDLQGTVWNTGGCSSYYLDKNGFNSVGFPWSTLEMQRLLKDFDAENYSLTPASQPVF